MTFERFKGPDRRGLFEASRDAIETDDGSVIEERLDSAGAFTEQTRTSHWDDLQLVHSAGFDLWHFFAQPFLLAMPGVRTEEIEAWEEAGETWRRLRAVFPEGLIAHAREQTYAFNSAGLLRRFEYAPARPGVPANINYAADHREFDGLMFATRRRMLPNDGTGGPLRAGADERRRERRRRQLSADALTTRSARGGTGRRRRPRAERREARRAGAPTGIRSGRWAVSTASAIASAASATPIELPRAPAIWASSGS